MSRLLTALLFNEVFILKIVVDADGCPVVNITINIAKDNNIKCIIVCDTSHEISNDYADTIIVSKGADSADFKIVNIINENDIVITQDYGLAAMCLSKKAFVLNQNGMIYSEKNIDDLLFSRHVSKVQRKAGKHLKGPKKRTGEQDIIFQKVLKETIKKALDK